MSNENEKKSFLPEKFTFLDYWVHFGIFLNLVVVFVLLWFGLTS